MKRQRLFSSDEIIAALQRGGFELARKKGGSHQAFTRQRPDGGHDVAVIPIGKREVPRGTLSAILKAAHVDFDEFLTWAKVKRKESRSQKTG